MVSCAYWAALAACGGGGAAGADGPAKAPSAAATPHVDPAEPSDDSTAEPAEAPTAAICDDGTCSPCGAGVCPKGWYCDESASGGPACGWLPRCAQKSSCGCLTGKIGAGCKCSEQGGGLHVTCK
ncbi:MAG TPA: hypothetical protein VER12_01510 [Polyangiaceae bacterium]|nr:hypothetical protein [Polyangiaceae bacterium]